MKSPANGAAMPPKVSHGPPARSAASSSRGLRGGGRLGPAAPVDVHEPRQAARAGLALEVPGGVGGGDRAAERVAAHHDLAAALLGQLDHAVEVLDLGVHPPLVGVADRVVGDELEVLGHARVVDEAEVVVEQLLGAALAGLDAVEHGVVLEQVLATLDRPHLPVLRLPHHVLGQRREVRRAGGGARVEDEHVARLLRADLEDADLVVLGRRAGGLDAGDALEGDRDLRHRGRGERGARERDGGDCQRELSRLRTP